MNLEEEFKRLRKKEDRTKELHHLAQQLETKLDKGDGIYGELHAQLTKLCKRLTDSKNEEAFGVITNEIAHECKVIKENLQHDLLTLNDVRRFVQEELLKEQEIVFGDTRSIEEFQKYKEEQKRSFILGMRIKHLLKTYAKNKSVILHEEEVEQKMMEMISEFINQGEVIMDNCNALMRAIDVQDPREKIAEMAIEISKQIQQRVENFKKLEDIEKAHLHAIEHALALEDEEEKTAVKMAA